MRRQDVEQLSASIKALLDSINAGDLAASSAMRHRLEGAMAALDAVLDRGSSLLDLGDVVDGGGQG